MEINAVKNFARTFHELLLEHEVYYAGILMGSLSITSPLFLLEYGGDHFMLCIPDNEKRRDVIEQLRLRLADENVTGLKELFCEWRVKPTDTKSLQFFATKFSEINQPYVGVAYDSEDNPHLLSPFPYYKKVFND